MTVCTGPHSFVIIADPHFHLQYWRSVKWSSRTLWRMIDLMFKLLHNHWLDLKLWNMNVWDHTFRNCRHVVCVWFIRFLFRFICLVYSFGFITWCFVFDILASDVPWPFSDPCDVPWPFSGEHLHAFFNALSHLRIRPRIWSPVIVPLPSCLSPVSSLFFSFLFLLFSFH